MLDFIFRCVTNSKTNSWKLHLNNYISKSKKQHSHLFLLSTYFPTYLQAQLHATSNKSHHQSSSRFSIEIMESERTFKLPIRSWDNLQKFCFRIRSGWLQDLHLYTTVLKLLQSSERKRKSTFPPNKVYILMCSQHDPNFARNAKRVFVWYDIVGKKWKKNSAMCVQTKG